MFDIAFNERFVIRVKIRLPVESLYWFMECVLTKFPSLEQDPHWRFEPAISTALVAVMRCIVLSGSVAAPARLAFDELKVVAIFGAEPSQDALFHFVEAFAPKSWWRRR